jgi:hypothetical protein
MDHLLLSGGSTNLEIVLRARIWCETHLAPNAWRCDHDGTFWFANIDDRALFVLTWK